MKRMIYPITPQEMGSAEIEDARVEEECKGCYVKRNHPEDYRDYCSLGICAKERE